MGTAAKKKRNFSAHDSRKKREYAFRCNHVAAKRCGPGENPGPFYISRLLYLYGTKTAAPSLVSYI